MANTPNNDIPYLPENVVDPAAATNLALDTIDTTLQLAVLAIQNTPPASATDGDRFIVGNDPTDEWADHAGEIAKWVNDPGYYTFATAHYALNLDDDNLYKFVGGSWVQSGGGGTASPPAAMFYINASQSIPDSAFTKVSWSATSYDTLGILTSPDTITIPSGKSLCRVTVGVAWALNATGERAARTNINDTTPYPVGVGWDRTLPSSDSNTPNNYTSGAFPVTPGDTVHIEVLQSSGVALDIVDSDPAARTFVCVELW